mmetsp:Transcript_96807/g.172228  ORF Transcript_96807/g.172228 Transcript_96807/m.172228 type:complete len:193 (-) Transcript_96807:206-784(-)|eukprot:CAMPEP_0197631012 /NCGR_PEP_ID=MMETSP1338-20131121/8324_1 /TAXON_ID=43686 ORGANISM="Pelagodinium beii, Strain RCC1491" /NCGR_SAMPLE_ID=MMETSP1338 /ASSEMBLY_ACC=CAM_ASM_000754 /LENGTH=192 /DNA_ID=CAMNT_0043202379 /DNA_START=139 /DNA_END=717 /DNA_ORIENTATION=+
MKQLGAQGPVQADREYDVRTAPVCPAVDGEEVQLIRKQIASLRSRVAKGGDESVLSHYRSVIREMEASLPAAKQPSPAKSQFVHVRVGSADSQISTASTRCPDNDDLLGDDLTGNSNHGISTSGNKALLQSLQQGKPAALPASVQHICYRTPAIAMHSSHVHRPMPPAHTVVSIRSPIQRHPAIQLPWPGSL